MARRKKITGEDKYVLGKKTEIEKVYASVHECHTLTLVDGKIISKSWGDTFYHIDFNNDLELCVVPRGIEKGKCRFSVSLENPYYRFERPNKTMEYTSVEFDFSFEFAGYQEDYPLITIPEEITGKLIANIEGILVSAYNADEDLDPAKMLADMNMVAQCVRTILNGEE